MALLAPVFQPFRQRRPSKLRLRRRGLGHGADSAARSITSARWLGRLAPLLAFPLMAPGPALAGSETGDGTTSLLAPVRRIQARLAAAEKSPQQSRSQEPQALRTLRFESEIEVHGKAPLDAQALTARLAEWLRTTDLKDGRTLGGQVTPREIFPYRPQVVRGPNFLPPLEWLYKRVRRDLANKMQPAEPAQATLAPAP